MSEVREANTIKDGNLCELPKGLQRAEQVKPKSQLTEPWKIGQKVYWRYSRIYGYNRKVELIPAVLIARGKKPKLLLADGGTKLVQWKDVLREHEVSR